MGKFAAADPMGRRMEVTVFATLANEWLTPGPVPAEANSGDGKKSTPHDQNVLDPATLEETKDIYRGGAKRATKRANLAVVLRDMLNTEKAYKGQFLAVKFVRVVFENGRPVILQRGGDGQFILM